MSITTGYAPQPLLAEWARNAQFQTLTEMFERTVGRVPDRWALGAKKDGTYHSITYRELKEKVDRVSFALMELGVAPEDRVAQLSPNRPEWVMTDLGILFSAAVHVPVYPTLAAHQVAYIVNDAGARVAFAATQDHLDRILHAREEMPQLQHVIVYDRFEAPADAAGLHIWSFDELVRLGAEKEPALFDERKNRLAAIDANSVASLVYTSGTTGEPKGAMLMHGNFVSNCTTTAPLMGISEDDVELSFLPLCHVFERIAYYALIHVGAHICYAESIETVPANLLEVHPTFLPSVPRLFEKIHARILEGAEAGSPLKKKIFKWAMSVGRTVRRGREAKEPMSVALLIAHKIARKLVFSKIRERTGGHIRNFISGGAPLRRDVAEFFADVGLTICEGYGLTETSPVITFNRPDSVRFGTVGQPIPHVEVKIAEDGEILARGPNIMRGYFNKPEDTKAVIDEDGWFHTGDIGRLDNDSFLTITDRKKEILVMSNGKNVPPQPIENLLKSSQYIEQAMVIGDNRNYITALVVPSFPALEAWARDKGIAARGPALVSDTQVKDFLHGHVQDLCRELSQYEKVKKIALLEKELSQDAGELTPTLKFKRRVILERYRDRVDALYE